MAWVQGAVSVFIDKSGCIDVRVDDMWVMPTARPKAIDEANADPAVFQAIRERSPGQYQSHAFLGGAVAMMARAEQLKLLPPRLMDFLYEKYGRFGSDIYLAEVRNTGAPAIWNVAEPSGGMAESCNLEAEQMGESVELGFYQEDGWCRFLLPAYLKRQQDWLDKEQQAWWSVVRPGFPHAYEAPVSFVSQAGQDTFNGASGVVAVGPVGDLSFVRIAAIDLPGKDWKVLDTEVRPGNPAIGEPEWIALNRKIVGIVNRYGGKSPLMLEFAPDGGLDPCGLHLALSGEALEYNISHLSTAALSALGWLKG